jgi:hypothetical protein
MRPLGRLCAPGAPSKRENCPASGQFDAKSQRLDLIAGASPRAFVAVRGAMSPRVSKRLRERFYSLNPKRVDGGRGERRQNLTGSAPPA